MYFKKFPAILRSIYPDYLWRVNVADKRVYLTFDDGPTPDVTEEVLRVLREFEAKGTFFLLGKNIQTSPHIAHTIIDEGHSIGNHGYGHLNGWKTNNFTYFKDFLQAQQVIQEYTGFQTELFRPAYGRINRKQALYIMKTHQIVMMDVLGGDFDVKLNGDDVFFNVMKHVQPGSIVCLHDSEKGWPRLSQALPQILSSLKAEGFRFEALNPIPLRSKATR